MCIIGNMDDCCSAKCTFKHLGSPRATYDISQIADYISDASACSTSFTSILEEGSRSVSVTALPLGNTCPVYGTCHTYNCHNIAQQNMPRMFVNEEYVTTVQPVTSSQSPSASLSNNPPGTQLTWTHLPIQSSSSIQQTSTNLPTFHPNPTTSPSVRQGMRPTTVFDDETSSIESSQMPPPMFSSSDSKQRLYIIVSSVLAAVLLCILLAVLTVVCLIFIFVKGKLYNYVIHTML